MSFTCRKVYIVGCGPGDPELLTVKAYKLLRECQVLLYTGSLLSPDIVKLAKRAELKINTYGLSSEQIASIMTYYYKKDKLVVWAHDGDPTIYGGLWKVLLILRDLGIPYEIVPGVSSVTAAAARLGLELTVPYHAQAVIITRPSLRAPMRQEERISSLAKARSTLVILLGAQAPEHIVQELMAAGYSPDEPIAIVYHATWRDEKIILCRLRELPDRVRENRITHCATIIVGPPLSAHLGLIRPRGIIVYERQHRHR